MFQCTIEAVQLILCTSLSFLSDNASELEGKPQLNIEENIDDESCESVKYLQTL